MIEISILNLTNGNKEIKKVLNTLQFSQLAVDYVYWKELTLFFIDFTEDEELQEGLFINIDPYTKEIMRFEVKRV